MSREVLVTGGAGFIGSHTVIQLLEAGYIPVIADLFSNSSVMCIERLEKITGMNNTVVSFFIFFFICARFFFSFAIFCCFL